MGNNSTANLAISNSNIRSKRYYAEINASAEKAKRYTLTELRRNGVNISVGKSRDNGAIINVVDTGIRYQIMVGLSRLDGKIAILNPADCINPGGEYISGGSGYEESICSNTTLYEVLTTCNSYYECNRAHVNGGLYTNVCLYTPDIAVFDNSQNIIRLIDVISCSSPDYGKVSRKRANKSIHDRIKLIFNTAVRNGVQHLILCGFGCNYNQSDVEYIASAFNEMCILYYASFCTITFVIDSVREADIFRNALGINV